MVIIPELHVDHEIVEIISEIRTTEAVSLKPGSITNGRFFNLAVQLVAMLDGCDTMWDVVHFRVGHRTPTAATGQAGCFRGTRVRVTVNAFSLWRAFLRMSYFNYNLDIRY